MKVRRSGALVALVAMLAACGGDDGGSNGGTAPPIGATPAPPPPPPSTTAGCSLRERQDWVNAQIRDWYLFPETLPASLSPAAYSTVDDFIDALTANARAQRKDRYFTYLTSIAEENAYYSSGSDAGFGIRFAVDSGARRLFVIESFETGPGYAAGIRRGTEVLGIGTGAGSVQSVSSLWASGGVDAVANALGPDQAGVARTLQLGGAGGDRTVSVTKANFALQPLSSEYGAKIIQDGAKKVGYLNMRTFIDTADPQLRAAFADFKAQGVSELIIDFRYNGGGIIDIAELMGDLLGANRQPTDVLSYTTYRPEKASRNETRYFQPKAQSIAPTKIAFIGTGSTASASELVINAMVPYLRGNVALVGTNTYGKPVGQIGLDRTQCDDRLRVVALATQNADRRGDYYNGLATTVERTCQASDDITRPLGDPQEASVATALNFLAGRTCTPIGGSGGGISAQSVREVRETLTPARPSTAQREVPGLF